MRASPGFEMFLIYPSPMNTLSYTLRKRISRYTTILACILFTGLGVYAFGPVVQLPDLAYLLFPVWIWGQIAVVYGDTSIVVGSILLLMALIIPLFICGYKYPENKQHGRWIMLWLIVFIALLAYRFIVSVFVHISAIYTLHMMPASPGKMYYPMPYTTIDEIRSKKAYIPPIYSMLSIVFAVVLCIYTSISVRILLLLREASKLEKQEEDLDNLSEV